jgi:hypothetical protein
MNLTHITVIAVERHLAKRRRVDSRVVMGQIVNIRLTRFDKVVNRGGVFEKACNIKRLSLVQGVRS